MLNAAVVIYFVLEPFYNKCDLTGIPKWNKENISSYRAPISVKWKSCLLDDTTPYKSSVDFLSDLVVVVSVNGKVLWGGKLSLIKSACNKFWICYLISTSTLGEVEYALREIRSSDIK